MSKGTIEQLRSIIALRDVSEENLQWLLDNAEFLEYKEGTLLTEKDKPIDHLWLIFEGSGKFFLEDNGKLNHYYTFENSEQSGGTGGLLPYSRMKTSPGFTYAEGTVKVFLLHKDHFKELENRDPLLVEKLIGYMTERARSFATLKIQNEKVSALGQIAAGIAHELNNPASAIGRISCELGKLIDKNYELTENLLRTGVKPEVITALKVIASEKEFDVFAKLSLMEKMDKEDGISDWFSNNGLKEFGNSSLTFAEAGITADDLVNIRNITDENSFQSVIHWFENYITSQKLMTDLGNTSGRISALVEAIKVHVHMDRTNEMQKCDIHKNIEISLTLLNHKINDKNITVERHYSPDLPPVDCYIGELNQVWTNLIDNAIHAMDKKGTLTIETAHDENCLTVKIIDDGHGIPKAITPRIFDPFFTTKKVGEGTGIGLDLVMRIVKQHNGTIKVNSDPGRTEFIVQIPITKPKTKKATK